MVVVQRPVTRDVGFAWLAIGFATYIVYRKLVIHEPLSRTVVAPPWSGPAAELEYRNILVPVGDDPESELALVYAARLAAERGARMVVVTVIEIPLELPLDAAMHEETAVANALLDEARAIGQSYGVRVVPRLIRARSFGRAVIEEAQNRHSEIIVVGAERNLRRRRPMVFSEIVEYILKHAPCRVLVAGGTPFDGVRTNGHSHAALAVRR